MGGAAFSSGADPLATPRMPPAVYAAARARCHAVLRGLFAVVATPVEGPAKADYGDVDVLLALPWGGQGVAQEAAQDTAALLAEAARRLGAVRAILRPDAATLAVRWPEDGEGEGEAEGKGEPGEKRHIQVDLAVLPSLPRFHWALFRHAHGDLWAILGAAVLRPLGLTADDRALWLRVPEIERAHRRRARVFLTDEPADVLRFLGLPLLRPEADGAGSTPSAPLSTFWEAPFATPAALFAYVAACRFFPDAPDLLPADAAASKDRHLLARPLFRQWATVFVPAARRAAAAGAAAAGAAAGRAAPTRDAVRDAAFAAFPGAAARYAAARTAWLREQHLLAVRAAAKAAVPADLPGRQRRAVCAAVQRYLRLEVRGEDEDDNDDEDDGEASERVADRAAAWTVEGVAAFVRAHWAALAAGDAPAETVARPVSGRPASAGQERPAIGQPPP